MKKSKSRLNWRFGGIALVSVGVVTAVTFALMRNDSVQETEVSSPTEIAAQAPEPVTAKSESQSEPAGNDSEPNTDKIQAKRQSAKEIKPAPETQNNTQPPRKRVVISPPEDEVSDDHGSDLDEWHLRREMRREERRLERRARREAWRRAEDPDGLFRVNDIFEGRRRP
jgi:hypothetical protein